MIARQRVDQIGIFLVDQLAEHHDVGDFPRADGAVLHRGALDADGHGGIGRPVARPVEVETRVDRDGPEELVRDRERLEHLLFRRRKHLHPPRDQKRVERTLVKRDAVHHEGRIAPAGNYELSVDVLLPRVHPVQAARHVRVYGGARADDELAALVARERDDRVRREVGEGRTSVGPEHHAAVRLGHQVLVDLVRRSDQDVDLPHVGLPARLGRVAEHPIRVEDPLLVAGAELVLRRGRFHVPPLPEPVDEVLPVHLGLHRLVGLHLRVRDDVADRALVPVLRRLVEVEARVGGMRLRRYEEEGQHRQEEEDDQQEAERQRPAWDLQRVVRPLTGRPRTVHRLEPQKAGGPERGQGDRSRGIVVVQVQAAGRLFRRWHGRFNPSIIANDFGGFRWTSGTGSRPSSPKSA